MLIHSSPLSQPVSPVAPAVPVGLSSSGEGTVLSQNTVFKPVEPSVKSEKNAVRSQSQESRLSEDDSDSKNSDSSSSENVDKTAEEKAQQEQERREISNLAARDREVRAHEQAHMAAGGQYSGAASYQYERGPDGVNYAVGGEVPISTGRESTPEATINKAKIVRRAALAPADPSPQDRRVAAQASAMEVKARKELVIQQRQETEATKASGGAEENSESTKSNTPVQASSDSAPLPEDNLSKKSSTDSDSVNRISSSPVPGSVGGQLLRSISNSALNAISPGSILEQIV